MAQINPSFHMLHFWIGILFLLVPFTLNTLDTPNITRNSFINQRPDEIVCLFSLLSHVLSHNDLVLDYVIHKASIECIYAT